MRCWPSSPCSPWPSCPSSPTSCPPRCSTPGRRISPQLGWSVRSAGEHHRLASPPLTLSPPSCDEDYFCGWNCRKCSQPEFCSSCGCTTSLGCARNCAKCSGDFSQPAGGQFSDLSWWLSAFLTGCLASDLVTGDNYIIYSDAPPGCVASSGPAAGSACIFPFIYEGVRYEGCAPLNGSDSQAGIWLSACKSTLQGPLKPLQLSLLVLH